VIFIDLLTIKKLVGTPVESLTPLQKWGLFFSYADDESKTKYVRQIAKSEEGIMEADRIAQRMSEEDANWFRQNSIDIARRDRNAELSAYREKGLTEGRQEKAVEAALVAIKEFGATPEVAAEKMGAPLELVLEALAAQPTHSKKTGAACWPPLLGLTFNCNS
jgi:hypothetical protein